MILSIKCSMVPAWFILVILVENINKYIYFSWLINSIKCNFKKRLRDEQKLDVLAEYVEMDNVTTFVFSVEVD